MKIEIWQMDAGNPHIFNGTGMGEKYCAVKNDTVDKEEYTLKYSFETIDRPDFQPRIGWTFADMDSILGEVYEYFNIRRPSDFKGHSLSVSDIVVLESEKEKGIYFVDSFGFKKVKWKL